MTAAEPIDAEEQALRDLGRQQDLTEGRPADSEGASPPETLAPPAEEPRPPQRPETPPDSEPEPEPPPQPPEQVEARERDERGRFKGQEPEPQPPPPPKSPYAQARERESREQERKDRSWQRLQSEKEAFRAQQAEWQDQRRLEQLQQESQVPPLQKDGIDLNGYHSAYLQFRQSGDYENAMKSLETVLELEQVANQQVAQRQEAQYELAWRNDMEVTIKALPGLMDPNSPLTAETDRIINEHPYLFYIPQGFQKAVEIATLLLAAGSDSELREENERLRAQLEGYQVSSQPARGGPGRPPQGVPSRQEDMSLDEEEAYLRDLTRREDSLMGR